MFHLNNRFLDSKEPDLYELRSKSKKNKLKNRNNMVSLMQHFKHTKLWVYIVYELNVHEKKV